MNVIMKFGGTSVADAEAMGRVLDIVARSRREAAPDTPPAVVVSAMSKVTDRLVETARLCAEGEADAAAAIVRDLLNRHIGVARGLVQGEGLPGLEVDLAAEFDDLASDVQRLADRREVPPEAYDAIVAKGELASSRIVAAAFAAKGIPAVWVDARQVLVTDQEHTVAAPDMEATAVRVRELVASRRAAGQVPVLGGFIGATAAGVTTTLGRGGSDYSAAIFGACLDVDEIQILIVLEWFMY